ncbi:MAG TPA: DUF2071 domain-containing protein [Gemmatimonadaceae bacterium]|nr:DUF2071 domain-containing protein [Gemmatimonadaceae bacterium]
MSSYESGVGSHRPWPAPSRPWLMAQRWHDLLFAHWPVPIEPIRALIPSALTLDLYDGMAWLAVTPFRMSGVRPRFFPALPWVSEFPELNVRTYVTLAGNKPGVFFFSLDAGNPLAVEVARRAFHLPYYRAEMRVTPAGNGDARTIHYTSRRTHEGAPSAELSGSYAPAGPVFRSRPGSLDSFLTERYCLYAVDSVSHIYRAEIDHPQWPLQPANARFDVNTMTAQIGITLPDASPLLHFSRYLEVVVWLPERVV